MREQTSLVAATAPPAPLLWHSRDAARVLSIGERLLWSLTQRGEVPCIRFGRAVRYSLAALQELVRARQEGGRP